ncbi:MAG: type II toxin-antitoxin system HicA family toxin [Saprospiraceae bacterium]|nr:type II toxin-antitoxin system HicA family toxin [Saprospiraceae bacterium]
MKIPRDITGAQLANKLSIYGYIITRQKGSHIRLTTQEPSEYHITIPNHTPLKIGTLSSILNAVANHRKVTKEQVIKELFG